jgi:hypothetical protein
MVHQKDYLTDLLADSEPNKHSADTNSCDGCGKSISSEAMDIHRKNCTGITRGRTPEKEIE